MSQHIRPWEYMPKLFKSHDIRLRRDEKPDKETCEKIYAIYQRVLVLLATKFIDAACHDTKKNNNDNMFREAYVNRVCIKDDMIHFSICVERIRPESRVTYTKIVLRDANAYIRRACCDIGWKVDNDMVHCYYDGKTTPFKYNIRAGEPDTDIVTPLDMSLEGRAKWCCSTTNRVICWCDKCVLLVQ